VHIALAVEHLPAAVADHEQRLGAAPLLVIPGQYALFRTDVLNLSLRVVPPGDSPVRHLGFEVDRADCFTEERDASGVVWETFTFEQQLAEIEAAWPGSTAELAAPPHRGLGTVSFRPPPLVSERVLLRGWEPADLEDVYAYASDPEVTRYLAWERHQSRADSAFFLDAIVATGYREGELNYALCLRESPQRVLGTVGLVRRDSTGRVMELGYVLARSAWGRGLVPEAGRLLIDHAFAATPVERIYAPVLAPNAKSRRAAEKMGLRFEGTLRSHLFLRGTAWDETIYGVLRADWEQACGAGGA
jgi:ribosomal-protein-alanine N-acetyltransferase